MPHHAFSRRRFLHLTGLTLTGLPLTSWGQAARRTPSFLVYVGTYAKPGADSIFLYRLDPATGALTRLRAEKGGENPSFLTLDAQQRHLYAVNEVENYEGQKSGFVSGFTIDRGTGGLTLLNQQPSGTAAPCYVSLDATGRAALVANYGGGTVSLLPLDTSGQLRPATATSQFHGSGPNRSRQEGPHAHCIIPDPVNRFAFAADLGTDRVHGFELAAAAGQLTPRATPAFVAQPGAGPRHLAFHPNGRWAYLVNELTSSVSALAYDAAAGTFRELHTLPALPAGFTAPNTCADVHVAPNGRFVYVSNRGHDSIVGFAVAPDTGRLKVVQHQSTQGKTPRNFAIAPSGTILLAANQNSNSIVTFFLNAQTGRLTPTGQSVEVPAPVCVQVVPDFTAK